MRSPLIAGNWKMFKTVQEAFIFAKELAPLIKDVVGVEVVVARRRSRRSTRCADALRNSGAFVAAQDIHWEKEGAFTGEISAPMVKEAGAEFVIIGHSERRTFFGETDALVNRKLHAALAAALTPIVCIGETLEQRDAGKMLAVPRPAVERRSRWPDARAGEGVSGVGLRAGLQAIGTRSRGHRRAQAQEGPCPYPGAVAPVVRGGCVRKLPCAATAASVKPDNIEGLLAEPVSDGALIGGPASMSAGLPTW